MAGGLADMIHSTITAEYEDLTVNCARIYLVERGTVLLAPFSTRAHEYASKVLQHDGVILKLNTETPPCSITLSHALSEFVELAKLAASVLGAV